ncbi:hypothetical protein ACT691_15265, partial [Vibrio metschnikovii]
NPLLDDKKRQMISIIWRLRLTTGVLNPHGLIDFTHHRPVFFKDNRDKLCFTHSRNSFHPLYLSIKTEKGLTDFLL